MFFKHEINQKLTREIPIELVDNILWHALPEVILSRFSHVNKELHEMTLSESLWKHKLFLHFPDVFEQNDVQKKTAGVFALFRKTYESRYLDLTPKQRMLFSIVHEGVPHLLLDIKGLTLQDLLATDSKDRNVLMAFYDNINHGLYKKDTIKTFLKNFSNFPQRNDFNLNYTPIFRLLLAHRELLETGTLKRPDDIYDNDGNSLLHVASYYGAKDIVDYLLARNPNAISTRNNLGQTPLLFAIRYGNLETLIQLVDHWQSDRKAVDKKGNNILHVVAYRAVDLKMVQWLLSLDPQKELIEQKNFDENTPIHCLPVNDFNWSSLLVKTKWWYRRNEETKIDIPEKLNLFCKHGANVFSTNKNGLTPLEKFIMNPNKFEVASCVRILGKYGAIHDNILENAKLLCDADPKVVNIIVSRRHFMYAWKELNKRDNFSSDSMIFCEQHLIKARQTDPQEFENYLNILLHNKMKSLSIEKRSIFLKNKSIQGTTYFVNQFLIARYILNDFSKDSELLALAKNFLFNILNMAITSSGPTNRDRERCLKNMLLNQEKLFSLEELKSFLQTPIVRETSLLDNQISIAKLIVRKCNDKNLLTLAENLLFKAKNTLEKNEDNADIRETCLNLLESCQKKLNLLGCQSQTSSFGNKM